MGPVTLTGGTTDGALIRGGRGSLPPVRDRWPLVGELSPPAVLPAHLGQTRAGVFAPSLEHETIRQTIKMFT